MTCGRLSNKFVVYPVTTPGTRIGAEWLSCMPAINDTSPMMINKRPTALNNTPIVSAKRGFIPGRQCHLEITAPDRCPLSLGGTTFLSFFTVDLFSYLHALKVHLSIDERATNCNSGPNC